MLITPKDVAERLYYLVIDSRFYPDEYEYRIMLYLHGLAQLGIIKEVQLSKTLATSYYGKRLTFKFIWMLEGLQTSIRISEDYHFPKGIGRPDIKEIRTRIWYPKDIDMIRNHLGLLQIISKDKRFEEM